MDRQMEIRQARIELAVNAAARWVDRQAARADQAWKLAHGGPAAAEPANRVAALRNREQARARAVIASSGLRTGERMIGATLDWASDPPSEAARNAGRPVARIVTLPEGGRAPVGIGTGFLVHPGLLLTNNHVLSDRRQAQGIGANFLHEESAAGLQTGPIFELNPDTFFATNETLDFTLVAVKSTGTAGEQLDALGHLPLIEVQGKILIGHPISIIQHPSGGPKRYATTQNLLVDVLDDFLHYTTDTLWGSSGSAGYNVHWEVVTLHHTGVPRMVNGRILDRSGQVWNAARQRDEEIDWIANEGVRVSSIVAYLRTLRPDRPQEAELLAAFLRATGDPLTERVVLGAPSAAPVPPSLPVASPALPVQIHITNSTFYVGQSVAVAAPPVPPLAPAPDVPVQAAPVHALAASAEAAAIRFDRRYDQRRGYDPGFLGRDVPLPTVVQSRFPEMVKHEGDVHVLHYHHFSLAMNRDRRLVMWSAVNVDYRPEMRDGRGRDAFGRDLWIPDPRIPGEAQIQDHEFYRPATRVDRGHIVRREDNVWGETALEREYANSDTFHWTNCTPQHEAFNQETKDGVWGRLEGRIKEQLAGAGNRASIFAGPVLADSDPVQAFGHGDVKYPLRFWKVVVVREEQEGTAALHAYGFILDQTDAVNRFGLEGLDFDGLRRWQVPLARIVEATGVELPQVLLDADVMAGEDGEVLIRNLDDVRVRGFATA